MPYPILTKLVRGGRPTARLSSPFTLALALAGPLLAACTVIVSDHGGHDQGAGDDAWGACYDDYDDCLDAADGGKAAVLACGDQLERCTADADDGVTSGHDSSASASAGASASASASGGADGGDDGAGDDGPAAEVCVALHQACVAAADTAGATLACEALFDHCAHPGVCEQDPCPKDCAGLDLCLDHYGACVAAATRAYEVEACNVVFDGCVADAGGDACLPADDAQVDACLAEHALCTACADGDAALAACTDVFAACVHPPM